ncbi:hypothetical protein F5144DRAFT_497736 [Chaetomium tenue]|uniref:Uncharacterized protein n=1 Tax=Chaetomium tenue TaxID=1854479 RepID=A0ACB7P259_9PEZI|nr:hypothetical protein F5144DRAFT_497736 [Chaetomium globosum]
MFSLLGVPSHSGSKTHKHGSRRSTSSTSTSTGHSKPKSSRSTQQRSVAAPGTFSAPFLFVVNELQVDYEPASPQEQPLTDQWLNTMPPQHAGAYVGEVVGTVFRYRDGVVSPAHGYLWNTRPGLGPSRGLSGELPIVIALMGFHGRPGRASEVFQSRKWDMGQWIGSSRASPYLPKSGESPRGLFVQVCADNLVDGLDDCEENNVPVEIWEQILQDLEYRTVLVQG